MFNGTRYEKNGVSKFEVPVNETKSTRMGTKTVMNEWIATCLMFFFSLSILIAKLYINYELVDKRLYSKQDDQSGMDILSCLRDWSNLTGVPDFSESVVKPLAMTCTQFLNITNQCAKASTDMVIMVSTEYEWLIRALFSGLIMTGFSWFIIYMDSRIPGIDPPFPLNMFKRRGYRIQINVEVNLNYLISVLVGLLVFITMSFGR